MTQGKILTAVSLSEARELRLTVDGLRDFLQDWRRHSGKPMPLAILVSEHDRRDLNQDLLSGSTTEVAKEDQRPEHDAAAIAVIEGVVIKSHPDVKRGAARLIMPVQKAPARAKLGGEGLIMVGAR